MEKANFMIGPEGVPGIGCARDGQEPAEKPHRTDGQNDLQRNERQ